MDQTQLNKLENPKDKVTQEKLLETNVLLDKWAKPAMTRRVLRKTTNGEHLTMIKKDYGIKRGVVEELTAFLLGTYCILERTDVANLAQKTLYKRSDCSGIILMTTKSPPKQFVLWNMLLTTRLASDFWSVVASTP